MHVMIEQIIADAVADSAHRPGVRTTWKAPLTAYAEAHDPLFARLKEVVRPTHATPTELLATAQTVIAYFLPFDESVSRSNQPDRYASEPWAVAYVETNALIRTINARLAEALEAQGHASVVLPPTHNFDTQSLLSDWSHKHVAYVAGLGQFGIHCMLITRQGSSGRLGSLVTSARLDPTPRSTQAACLYTYNRSCQACIRRCPAGALTETSFDRQACYALCLQNAERNEQHGLADVCGKCLSVVPCSFKDPVAELMEKASRPAQDSAGSRG
jgi:epoxyqueuosine reductase QueG